MYEKRIIFILYRTHIPMSYNFVYVQNTCPDELYIATSFYFLQDTYPDELLAAALKAVIKQSGISPTQIGDICCGKLSILCTY